MVIPVPNPATLAGKVIVFVLKSWVAANFPAVTLTSLTFAVSTASVANLAAVTNPSSNWDVVKGASVGFVPTYPMC